MPRPFGTAFHGTKLNDLLQFVYIELKPSSIGAKHILILRDDHSSYCWFLAFPDTVAKNAATSIVDRCAAFGVQNGLMSDGPTRFKNETVCLVPKGLTVPHHFTPPYCPRSNGAVDRLGQELLRVMRAIVGKLQLRFEKWPDLLPIVQSAINNAPSPQRGNISPIMAFNGIKLTPPIKTFYRSAKSRPVTMSDLAAERAVNVKALSEKMPELHPLIHQKLTNKRHLVRVASSRSRLLNFDIGDYVLVARANFSEEEKLALLWRGLRCVVNSDSEYIYTVEDLPNGVKTDVHVTRLKFYRVRELNTNAVMSHILASKTGMAVARLVVLQNTLISLKVCVRWRGLPDAEETLEPTGNVYEDVPKMLHSLLSRKTTPMPLFSLARCELGL